MRKFLKIFYLLLLAMFSLSVDAEENKKELRVTLQSSVITLDPGGVQDSQSLFVSRQINCQLLRYQGSIFVLEAAESIKYISPLKIIIKLNNKVKFHDGTLVSAKDVVASFNYIKTSRNIYIKKTYS